MQVQVKEKKKAQQAQQSATQQPEGQTVQAGETTTAKADDVSTDKPKYHAEDEYISSWDCVRKTVAREGWQGLYSGLTSAIFGVGVSSAIYFWWYLFIKRLVLRRLGAKDLTPFWNIVVAALSGVINITLTSPIWVINLRMTLQSNKPQEGDNGKNYNYKGIVDAFVRIAREEGIKGLYRGYLASVVLVSNPVIQFVLYDQIMTRLGNYRLAKLMRATAAVRAVSAAVGSGAGSTSAATEAVSTTDPRSLVGSGETFFISAFAKLIATIVTYPYLVVKSRQQADRGDMDKAPSMLATMANMLRKEGLSAFYSGLDAKMYQTVTNAAISLMIYERVVRIVRFAVYKLMELTGGAPGRT